MSIEKQTIDLPLFVMASKNRKKWLTLNSYRNWHYSVSNNCKKNFKRDIKELLNFRLDGKVKIDYEYYAPDKRKRDLMNVISVVDKFFQDAMVETGCIEADDMSIVVEVNSRFVAIDKQNPRLTATITKIE
jgi:hypothetical protein